MRYEETEEGKVKPPVYLDEAGETISMGYVSGGYYSCLLYTSETGGFIPAKVLEPGIVEAKKVICEKMELFGSVGKAALYD